MNFYKVVLIIICKHLEIFLKQLVASGSLITSLYSLRLSEYSFVITSWQVTLIDRYDVSIGGFHSILLPRKTLGGQLYTYCRFVPRGSEQILSNWIHVLPHTRSIPMMKHVWLDYKALNVSRDSTVRQTRKYCRGHKMFPINVFL